MHCHEHRLQQLVVLKDLSTISGYMDLMGCVSLTRRLNQNWDNRYKKSDAGLLDCTEEDVANYNARRAPLHTIKRSSPLHTATLMTTSNTGIGLSHYNHHPKPGVWRHHHGSYHFSHTTMAMNLSMHNPPYTYCDVKLLDRIWDAWLWLLGSIVFLFQV